MRENALQRLGSLGQDMSTPDVLAEFENVGKARCAHLGGDRCRGHPGRLGPCFKKASDQDGGRIARRERHVDPELEAPPDRAVQQFGMIGRGDHHDIARQLVELHQQKRDDALDLTGLVDVAALFADRIEFVEKKNAGRRTHIFEQSREPRIGFTEICTHQRVIANRQQGDGDSLGDGLSERRLAIARGAGQQNPMPRLHALGAQQVGSVLLFNKLAGEVLRRQRQNKVVERDTGF